MFYVLFLEPDFDSVYFVRKFSSLHSARAYCNLFSFLGSINCLITSQDLQTVYFKTFANGKT